MRGLKGGLGSWHVIRVKHFSVVFVAWASRSSTSKEHLNSLHAVAIGFMLSDICQG